MSAMEVDDAPAVPDPVVAAFEAAEAAEPSSAGAFLAVVTGFQDAPLEEAGVRAKEACIYRVAALEAASGDARAVVDLLASAAPFFGAIAKAKVAKIVRRLLEIVAERSETLDLQADLCAKVVAWCLAEKRTFLRQRVESRLVAIDFERGRYDSALALVNRLLRELKKLDDKQMLVETHLSEARIHAALRNVPKAKAALTAARANGNAVYVGPRLQAQLDEMSGTLHCEECDYHTSHSYFLEAYEAYDSLADAPNDATRCLKYMLLCQILSPPVKGGARDETAAMDAAAAAASSTQYAKYAGPGLDSMADVARAAKKRSLEAFEACTAKYGSILGADLLIKHHLDMLYDRILETNLSKIIEAFSKVEIARVADLIALPAPRVERKLAQMILDKKLNGTLDQGAGVLVLHEISDEDPTYAASSTVIKNMAAVVESLFHRADALDA